jgi:hypothetical protein
MRLHSTGAEYMPVGTAILKSLKFDSFVQPTIRFLELKNKLVPVTPLLRYAHCSKYRKEKKGEQSVSLFKAEFTELEVTQIFILKKKERRVNIEQVSSQAHRYRYRQ